MASKQFHGNGLCNIITEVKATWNNGDHLKRLK